MSLESIAWIRDRRSGSLVEATLIDGVTKQQVAAAETSWRAWLHRRIRTMELRGEPVRLEHSHWDWRRKFAAIEGLLAYRMLGIMCRQQMQGLMLASIAGHFCRISLIERMIVYRFKQTVAGEPPNLPVNAASIRTPKRPTARPVQGLKTAKRD